MWDDQRVYSDEEFALILRQVAELGGPSEPAGASSAGLTLTEMKAIAAQVGLDPDLVERVARRLPSTTTASLLERLIGGPLRHDHEVRFPIKLDENRAALLLSAVRIRAGLAARRDVGHSGSNGMTWHDGGDPVALRVTACPEEDGTAVSVVLDRGVTFGVVAMLSGIVMFFVFLFAAFALYPEAPAQGYGGFVAGIGGVLAAARGYWASSTRKARERMTVVMDAIRQTLAQPQIQTSGAAGDGVAAPEPEATVVTDAEPTGA